MRPRGFVELVLALLVGTLVLAACGHKRTTLKSVAGAEARVGRIHIEGNESIDDKAIEENMNLQETRWFPLPKREWYLPGLIPLDRKRIEEYYALRGFHDAQVTSIEPKFRRKDEVVDIEIEIDESAPTLVREVRFDWPDGVPDGPPDRRTQPAAIAARCGLTRGERFDVEELRTSEAAMREALLRRGHAFAEVVGSAEVDRIGRTADVQFEVRPGPFVRLGKIRIEGLVAVPEKALRNEVDNYEGKPFSPTRIRSMEQLVYGLEVFSTVAVTLAEKPREGPHGPLVDVLITVTESQPQSIRLGGGFGVDPNRWEQYGAMRYSHSNIDRKLARFDLGLKIGYAELPAIWNPQEHGPIGELTPTVRRKGWLEKKLVWTAAPSFELGIQNGYQFYAPKTRLGVSRFFTRFFELDLSHNFRFVDFFNVAPALDESRSILGLDFRDPYLLSFIQLRATVHLTDRAVDPRNGVVLGNTWDLAGSYLGGDYDYNRVTPEIRGYYTPLRDRLQFAVRGQVGFIVPYGKKPGAPFDLKYYLGGSNTVRGYAFREISPAVNFCNDDESCRGIPVGGQTMVSASAEIRLRVWSKLWLVAFTDMGDVRAGVNEFSPRVWSYTMGPGIRFHSKIGVFRLDGGFRLNDTEYGEGQPIGALHFGLGEAF